MAISTYDDLKTAIGNWLDRDDLTPYVDDFIDLAEERHKKEIRLRSQLVRTSLTVDARHVTYPSAALDAIHVRLLTDPVTWLQPCDLEKMSRVRREVSDRPQWFTIHADIEFDVTPDQSYTGEIIYYAAVTALSDANTTNDILDAGPAAYLYGSLAAAAPFLENDERLPVWETLYQRARDDLNSLARNERQIGTPVVRVAGLMP